MKRLIVLAYVLVSAGCATPPVRERPDSAPPVSTGEVRIALGEVGSSELVVVAGEAVLLILPKPVGRLFVSREEKETTLIEVPVRSTPVRIVLGEVGKYYGQVFSIAYIPPGVSLDARDRARLKERTIVLRVLKQRPQH